MSAYMRRMKNNHDKLISFAEELKNYYLEESLLVQVNGFTGICSTMD